MNDSIIKHKASLVAVLLKLIYKFEESEACVIFKEIGSDSASIFLFYCYAVEDILYFLAHKVVSYYQ